MAVAPKILTTDQTGNGSGGSRIVNEKTEPIAADMIAFLVRSGEWLIPAVAYSNRALTQILESSKTSR